MSSQPDDEATLLKRKLWRVGVIADALERKLANPLLKKDPLLRDEIIKSGLQELFTEVIRPLGRQTRGRLSAKASRKTSRS